jgi:hypothetical protein
MNRRVPLIVLAALLLCLPSACKRSANTAHLATLDSLLIITDSLITGINAMDLTALHTIDSTFKLKKDAVEARMRDTLSKPDAILLANFHRAMTKNLPGVNNEFSGVKNDLDLAKKQLIDLRHDVEKGLLDAPVESGFIGQEKMAVSAVREHASKLASSARGVVRDHERLAPQVDSLLIRAATLHQR